MDTSGPAAPLDPALATLTRYYSAIDRFDLDDLLACFSEDAAYGHPLIKVWKPELAAPIAHGRQAIRAFLEECRKKRDTIHRVTGFGRASGVGGAEAGDFYVATVVGGTATEIGAACITFEVDSANLITRYFSYVAPVSYDLRISAHQIFTSRDAS